MASPISRPLIQEAVRFRLCLVEVDGTFGAASSVAVAASPSEIVSGDFDGDGIADLAVAAKRNNDSVWATAMAQRFVRGDIAVNSSSITSADFNGDGKVDLAVVRVAKCRFCSTKAMARSRLGRALHR